MREHRQEIDRWLCTVLTLITTESFVEDPEIDCTGDAE